MLIRSSYFMGFTLAAGFTSLALVVPGARVELPEVPALRLSYPGDLGLLARFDDPAVERPSASAAFLRGTWGASTWTWPRRLTLDLLSEAPALDALAPPAGPTAPSACSRRKVTFARYGAETDTFRLLACDGSLDADSLDRLSSIARPPLAARPALPLPDEPEADAARAGEWVQDVRLVHPRLAWLAQRVADAFPRRTIYVVSGYRPGSHEGMHHAARALDIHVTGVDDRDLYRFCRTLVDVGCGYYPNSTFVHVDVRPPGTGHAYWVDVSTPGERSRYVDGWPGVEESGAAVWNRWRERDAGAADALGSIVP